MTELEKVIRGLECHIGKSGLECEDCPYQAGLFLLDCSNIMMSNALALLKGQEPITPCIRVEEGFSYNDLTRQYGCGSCGKPIDRGDGFCRHCGKKVKWDGRT